MIIDTDMFYLTIAIKASYLAHCKGLTQTQLARRTGWSQPQASGKLSNRLPIQPKELYRLASALGVTPSELVPDADEAMALLRWAEINKPNAITNAGIDLADDGF